MLSNNLFKYVISLLILTMSCTPLAPDSNNYIVWNGWQNTPPEISIEVRSSTEVHRSDSLRFKITLTNRSNKEIIVGAGNSFSKQLEFNLVVVNQNNQIVWSRFPHNANSTLEMYTINLEPGAAYEMEGVWLIEDQQGDKISRGKYQLFGGLHGLEIQTLQDDKIVNAINFGLKPVGSEPLVVLVK